jgi:vitamin B12 transporter
LFFTPATARAVVVRGVVTDPLGRPVPGARIQLVQGPKAVAIGVAGSDGSYEIRSTEAGRFVLLTSSAQFYPGVGTDFYGGSTDEVTQNVVLETASVHEEVTVTATGLPTPVEQSSAAVTLIPESDLATTVGIVRRAAPVARRRCGADGADGRRDLAVCARRQLHANKVLIDGIPADDVGGTFDFGTVSSTGWRGWSSTAAPTRRSTARTQELRW